MTLAKAAVQAKLDTEIQMKNQIVASLAKVNADLKMARADYDKEAQ